MDVGPLPRLVFLRRSEDRGCSTRHLLPRECRKRWRIGLGERSLAQNRLIGQDEGPDTAEFAWLQAIALLFAPFPANARGVILVSGLNDARIDWILPQLVS